MKKNIAIVTGGDSSEVVISLKSAEQVRLALDPEKYRPTIVYIRGDDWHVRLQPESIDPDLESVKQDHESSGQDPETKDQGPMEPMKIPIDRENFSFTLKGRLHRFDYAFIAMHGPPGEDGQLQAYFDKLGIPYSTSGSRSLALSFNKYASKELLRKSGILTAEAVLVRREDGQITRERAGEILERIGLPCFIKPNAGGSSFGVSRINRVEELEKAIRKALEEDDEVLVETFIPGNELTCGLLKTTHHEFLFPVTEIISKNEFFDYEAKYTAGMADEVTPAEIPDELAAECQALSSRIYDLMDCRGLVRIDFINHEGRLYFLELNGIPGMSRESIIPKMIRTMGHTEAEIYNLIIKETAGS